MGRLDGRVAIITGGGARAGGRLCRSAGRGRRRHHGRRRGRHRDHGRIDHRSRRARAGVCLRRHRPGPDRGHGRCHAGGLRAHRHLDQQCRPGGRFRPRLVPRHRRGRMGFGDAGQHRGAFSCAKAVVPHMRQAGYGKIVNISSGTVFKGTTRMLHYVSSKGAVIAFTRALAREVGDLGICVNCLAPGLTMSEKIRGKHAVRRQQGAQHRNPGDQARGAARRPARRNALSVLARQRFRHRPDPGGRRRRGGCISGGGGVRGGAVRRA